LQHFCQFFPFAAAPDPSPAQVETAEKMGKWLSSQVCEKHTIVHQNKHFGPALALINPLIVCHLQNHLNSLK